MLPLSMLSYFGIHSYTPPSELINDILILVYPHLGRLCPPTLGMLSVLISNTSPLFILIGYCHKSESVTPSHIDNIHAYLKRVDHS
jgi:hypothetical protein